MERSTPTRLGYDRVAAEYARRMTAELTHKPFDRALLDDFAAEVGITGTKGTSCDLGCGPGQVAAYLHERGAAVCGIDLSPAMVAEAARQHPGIPFTQGDILALTGVADASFVGVAAFYSLIHIERASMVVALREIRRVLRPGGRLLLSFHVGDEVRHLHEWWGEAVALDFHFFQPDDMLGALRTTGFTDCAVFERAPYPDVEVATQRAYIVARKPTVAAEEWRAIRRADPTEAARLSALAFAAKAYWGYDAAFMEACRAELTIAPEAINAGGVYVAVSGEQVLGFGELGQVGDEAEVVNLFVAPEALGQGVGTRLWQHLARLATAQGYRTLVVQSDPFAEAFYRAMGMVRYAETPSSSIPGRVLPQLRIRLSPQAIAAE